MRNGHVFPSKVCHFQYDHRFLFSRGMGNIRAYKEVRLKWRIEFSFPFSVKCSDRNFKCFLSQFRKTHRSPLIYNVLLDLFSLQLCLLFFLKWLNYIKIFVLYESALFLPNVFSHRLTSKTSQKHNRCIAILWRTLQWIFRKWSCTLPFMQNTLKDTFSIIFPKSN